MAFPDQPHLLGFLSFTQQPGVGFKATTFLGIPFPPATTRFRDFFGFRVPSAGGNRDQGAELQVCKRIPLEGVGEADAVPARRLRIDLHKVFMIEGV